MEKYSVIVTHENQDGILVIGLPERFDTNSAPDVEADLKILMNSSFQNMLFDCSHMVYIASAGIRVLLITTKTLMKSGKKVAFCSLRPNVRQVFEIGGFTRIFSIYDSQNTALKSMK